MLRNNLQQRLYLRVNSPATRVEIGIENPFGWHLISVRKIRTKFGTRKLAHKNNVSYLKE